MSHAKKLPIGTTRYRKKTENEETKLHGQSTTDVLMEIENERSKVQLEINKLIFAIEDPLVPMTDAEVQETNDEINRKLQLKYTIETDILKMTRGARDYIPAELKGNLNQYKYFGRAKEIQKNSESGKQRDGGAAVAAGLVKLGRAEKSADFQVDAAIEEALKARQTKTARDRKRKNVFDEISSDSEASPVSSKNKK
jgi:Isy1-like splicing family